jgi:hypothetical protein
MMGTFLAKFLYIAVLGHLQSTRESRWSENLILNLLIIMTTSIILETAKNSRRAT